MLINCSCKTTFLLLFFSFFIKINGDDLPNPPVPDSNVCQKISDNRRLDCFPQNDANQEKCEERGCCWLIPDSNEELNVPYCFYPETQEAFYYNFKNTSKNENSISVFFERKYKSPYPNDIQNVEIRTIYITDSIVQIKILDTSEKRFESPFPDIELPSNPVESPNYNVSVGSYGVEIIRRSDQQPIFDTFNLTNFIFSDQFLQLSSSLTSENVYGLGELKKRFKLPLNWTKYTYFNHDAAPQFNVNLYGTHPFYMVVENSGRAHGVFLKNSNGMEITLQPSPSITFRTIGGIFDFFVFTGPTPTKVLQQYQEIIGKPKMPPYWALGFHLCRWGNKDLNMTKEVLKRNLDAGVPVEVQWNDLDYMENRNDFTYDKNAYAGLPEFVKDLHDQGRRYSVLIDPGVSGSEKKGTYPPYERGVELDVFVKNSTGQIFVGKVWNSISTVFPDFTHPNIHEYWKESLKNFHDEVPFDGAWIDMNEPSNSEWPYGCPDNSLENPPYSLAIDGGGELYVKTFCMSAKQYAGVHYNLHNLYGISEGNITNRAMSEILGERSFILSRSTFPGFGKYGAHWGGDVFSTWEDMNYTIPLLLDFSLFGIPLMGSDICGFNGNTDEDLCNRWMQLGAFYPFSRNHNSIDMRDQDPAAMGEKVLKSSIKALTTRYKLLPYLYTLFFEASTYGLTVARPLVVEFPEDKNTHKIENSFLWGSALLIAPVLTANPPSIPVYLPRGIWYNFYTQEKIESSGEFFDISTDEETIPLFLRGGSIIPVATRFEPLTEKIRNSNLTIIIALDEKQEAVGKYYFDDGISIDMEGYSLLDFNYGFEGISVNSISESSSELPYIEKIEIWGSNNTENGMTEVYCEEERFDVKFENKRVIIENLNLKKNTKISFK